MGLYKGKVQSIFTGSCILPSADDKKKEGKKEEVIYQEAQHTSSWTRGLKS
jgi:hypothetical protein